MLHTFENGHVLQNSSIILQSIVSSCIWAVLRPSAVVEFHCLSVRVSTTFSICLCSVCVCVWGGGGGSGGGRGSPFKWPYSHV